MKQKLKKLSICLLSVGLILGLSYWGYIEYWKRHAYEKLFNMEEILGKTDNNPYGIRNDVYDFLVNEEFVKWGMNEKQKNLVLNYAHYDQQMIKNFTNKEKVLEIFAIQSLLITQCRDRKDPNDKFSEWLSRVNQQDYYGPSKYMKTLEKHPDSMTILLFYNKLVVNNYAEIKYLDKNKTDKEIEKMCENYENGIVKYE